MASENKIPDPIFSAFDGVAETYDISFSHSSIGRLQRKRVHAFLEKSLSKKAVDILEINCGTGEDAVWLGLKGHRIIATDRSSKMIEMVSLKIQQHHLDSRVRAIPIAFDNLKDHFEPASFDLIFSNFGGLNCVDEKGLGQLNDTAAYLLKPAGRFVAVIMGRKCWWEQFYFLLKGNKKQAFRRKSKNPVQVQLGNALQSTWYYAPGEIEKIFATKFQRKKLKPVGIFVPPSFLESFFSKRKLLLNILNNLEAIFSFSLLSNQADHFYVELQKMN